MNSLADAMPPVDGRLRFSTRALPRSDRVAIWREEFGQRFVRLDMEPLGDDPLHYEAVFQNLGDMSLGIGELSAISCARTKSLIEDGNDNIVLLIQQDDQVRAELGPLDAELRPGECLVRCSNEPGQTRLRPGRFVTLALPVAGLAQRVADIDRLMLTVLPAKGEALHLLVGYCRAILTQPGPLSPAMAHLACDHLQDLAALAIGAHRDAWHVAQTRGLRAARRARAVAMIRRNATDPGFRAAHLAHALHVSESYLRKLLAEQGKTFSTLLLEARLERAQARLADPRSADHQIGRIALDCGFNDISYFNRTFHRRYGCTPSEARKAGQGAAERG